MAGEGCLRKHKGLVAGMKGDVFTPGSRSRRMSG